MPETPILEVTGLTAGYGGPPIIQDVSIQAAARSMTAIVGANGSGKSTLLKAIVGVIRPSSGQVRVGGELITGLSADKAVRKGVAYVPQVANVFPSLTVRENLEMGGYIRKSGLEHRLAEPGGLVSGPTRGLKRS